MSKFKKDKPRHENAGRKQGTLNKRTIITKALVLPMQENMAKQIKKDWLKCCKTLDSLTGTAYLDYYFKMMEFVLPKINRVEHAGNVTLEKSEWEIGDKKFSFS